MGGSLSEETLTVRGGCQCGAVRYEAKAASGDAYYCHCRMCQRAFGHLSGIFCEVDRRSVKWETVALPQADFRSLARPIESWL